jgi:hypothetical protein
MTRSTSLLLALVLSLPATGALAQSAPATQLREADAVGDVLRSRGTPGGRVGGATRGIDKSAAHAAHEASGVARADATTVGAAKKTATSGAGTPAKP